VPATVKHKGFLINDLTKNERTFIDNDDKVKLYTGLPSYDILICTYTSYRFVLPNINCITKQMFTFQQYMMTLNMALCD